MAVDGKLLTHADAMAVVQRSVASVLGREVPAGAPLMDAGLDSLGAVELRTALEREVGSAGVAVPATAVFDYPSAEALARYDSLPTRTPGCEVLVRSRPTLAMRPPAACAVDASGGRALSQRGRVAPRPPASRGAPCSTAPQSEVKCQFTSLHFTSLLTRRRAA